MTIQPGLSFLLIVLYIYIYIENIFKIIKKWFINNFEEINLVLNPKLLHNSLSVEPNNIHITVGMHYLLTKLHSIIRYKSRVSGAIQGKELHPSLHHNEVAIKENLQNLTIYIYIYIYIYWSI